MHGSVQDGSPAIVLKNQFRPVIGKYMPMNRNSYHAPEGLAAALSPRVDPAPSLSPPVAQADTRLAFSPDSKRARQDARVATEAHGKCERGAERGEGEKPHADDGMHCRLPAFVWTSRMLPERHNIHISLSDENFVAVRQLSLVQNVRRDAGCDTYSTDNRR